METTPPLCSPPRQEVPAEVTPGQRADHSELPAAAAAQEEEEEEATTVGGGASGLGLAEVGPSPVMLELDETGTVIAKLNAIPEEALGTVGGDSLVLNSSRGILDVIPEEEQLGSPTEVEGGGAVGVVSEQAENEKVAAVESEGRVVEGGSEGVTEGGVVMEEGSGEGVTGEGGGVGVAVESRADERDTTAEGSSAGVIEEEKMELSEVPSIITSEENEPPKETEDEVMFHGLL